MLQALANLGPSAKDAVPALREALEKRDWGGDGERLIQDALESLERNK